MRLPKTSATVPVRLALTTAALGLALTGCTSVGGGAAPTGGSTSPSSPASASPASSSSSAASASAPASAPGSGSTPTSAPAPTGTEAGGAPAAPACTGAQISVGDGPSDGAAGHIGIPLLFLNFSDRTCTLYGFPGVAGLNANYQQVVQAQRVTQGYLGTEAVSTVTLAPGASASALLAAVDVPSGGATSCPSYGALLVTPPGTQQSTRVVLAPVPGCPTLQIYPVVPGKTGHS
jgi:hypothetical protein